VAYRFYGFCRRRRTTDGGKRNVCNEQYTERASLPISFLIKELRENRYAEAALNEITCV
jgi:hypothetical protein